MKLSDGYIKIESRITFEKSDWCSDNLEMFDWKIKLNGRRGSYYFKNKEDAVMFKVMFV